MDDQQASDDTYGQFLGQEPIMQFFAWTGISREIPDGAMMRTKAISCWRAAWPPPTSRPSSRAGWSHDARGEWSRLGSHTPDDTVRSRAPLR